MSFQFINISGGVVIPGTAYIEYSDDNLQPEYVVLAEVFDSKLNPEDSLSMLIHRTPYFSIAEWYCEWANTGEAPPFDLCAILPSNAESQKMAI
jgi:hypothetical protein